MTNKEKAREISSTYHYPENRGIAERAATKMAEWKDQQFKEYLEELIDKTQHQVGLIFRDIMKRRDDYSALDEDFMRKRVREEMSKIVDKLFKEN